MAAITSAVLGAAALGYGAYSSIQGKNQQKAALEQQQAGYLKQQQGANLQYQLEIDKSNASKQYAGFEYDLNKGLAEYSKNVALNSAAVNKGIVDTQFQMEAQRHQAMELDAKRQQLEIIRNHQRNRALAATSATAQGALFGSGLQGGYGQLSGVSNTNALGVQQQLNLGNNMFNLNKQLAGQKQNSIDLESAYAAYRADQQTQRAGLTYNYAMLNADYQTQAAGIQTNYMSAGQGMVNSSQGMYQLGASQSQFGAQLMQMGANIGSLGNTVNNITGYASAAPGWGYSGSGAQNVGSYSLAGIFGKYT